MPTETDRNSIGTSVTEEYDLLLIEAMAISARIANELANGQFPAGLRWGDVGDMTETIKALRHVSDRMFAEGEYAPEAM